MDPRWLAILALTLGVTIGVVFMIVLHAAERHGQRAAGVIAPSVPEGVEQVMGLLASAGVVLDPSNNVLRASEGAFALGLVRNQSLAHDSLKEVAARVRRTGEPVIQDLRIPRGPLGEGTIPAKILAAPLGTRFVLLLLEDRTEATRLDEIRRDFIVNISHELKTPIASVSLLAEAITEAALDPKQVRKFTKRLSGEATRLANITEEIIELSRLQAQEIGSASVLLNIDHIVARAIDETQVLAEASKVKVLVRAKSGAQVYGNPELLVVAIHNLIANAIAYSAKKDQVGVATKTVGNIVEISVTDRGIGIDKADHERVFERFYRADEARARKTGGSGLGLSIVKHTVQNHGGDVLLWSQPNLGSTFTIRLPLAEAAGGENSASAPSKKAAR